MQIDVLTGHLEIFFFFFNLKRIWINISLSIILQ